jgi:hypothetical protein
MAAAFAAALAAALGVLMIKGAGESGLAISLRVTARIAYLFFWPAYVGAAVATLFGAPLDIVARRAREFGLAFASALFVHVALVIWLAVISPPQPLADTAMPFFAIGIAWAYLLAVISIDQVRTKFDAYSVRVVRTIGTEYIALVFFADFVILPKHPLQYPVLYIPFWAMLGLGPLLRLGATVWRLYRLGPVSAA